MHKIIAFILLLALMAQTFNQGLYYVGYFANRAAYARKCENKARPQLHCNGKCQIMKKILEDEKKQAQYPEMKRVDKAEDFSPTASITLQAPFSGEVAPAAFSDQPEGSPVGCMHTFFHPPCA